MDIDPTLAAVIAIAAVVVIVVMVIGLKRQRQLARRADAIEDRFGREYDRLRDESGRREAVEALEETADRLDDTDVRRISPADREVFTERWSELQHGFLDTPADAVRRADELVTDVLRARNLPVGSVEERLRAVADLDEDGAIAVELRDAHELFVALESDEAEETLTSDLRAAMLVYQRAFELALDRPKSEQRERVDQRPSEPVRRPS